MLEMTPTAGEFLYAVLERAQAPAEAAIRLEIDGETLTSRIDHPRPGDTTLEHEGRNVLVLDERVAELLDGINLDLQPGDEGDSLVLAH
jgi:hypothetical protein